MISPRHPTATPEPASSTDSTTKSTPPFTMAPSPPTKRPRSSASPNRSDQRSQNVRRIRRSGRPARRHLSRPIDARTAAGHSTILKLMNDRLWNGHSVPTSDQIRVGSATTKAGDIFGDRTGAGVGVVEAIRELGGGREMKLGDGVDALRGS